MSRLRGLIRTQHLVALACIVAAVCVGASEFMTMFQFERGTSGEPLKTIAASERHYYATVLIAVFAIVAVIAAVLTGSRPAATAVAVAGMLSLLIFLLVDLPDVNQEGSLDDPTFEFFASKASPAAGFWFLMVGSIGLAVAGIALATLSEEQLRIRFAGDGSGGRVAALPEEAPVGRDPHRARAGSAPAESDRETAKRAETQRRP